MFYLKLRGWTTRLLRIYEDYLTLSGGIEDHFSPSN